MLGWKRNSIWIPLHGPVGSTSSLLGQKQHSHSLNQPHCCVITFIINNDGKMLDVVRGATDPIKQQLKKLLSRSRRPRRRSPHVNAQMLTPRCGRPSLVLGDGAAAELGAPPDAVDTLTLCSFWHRLGSRAENKFLLLHQQSKSTKRKRREADVSPPKHIYLLQSKRRVNVSAASAAVNETHK